MWLGYHNEGPLPARRLCHLCSYRNPANEGQGRTALINPTRNAPPSTECIGGSLNQYLCIYLIRWHAKASKCFVLLKRFWYPLHRHWKGEKLGWLMRKARTKSLQSGACDCQRLLRLRYRAPTSSATHHQTHQCKNVEFEVQSSIWFCIIFV